MATLSTLSVACGEEPQRLIEKAQPGLLLWERWLQPVCADAPAGDDIGYDDDFQQIREEVNKLSGINTELICTLAEKLLVEGSKDLRVATFYVWARLQQDGESGFAEALCLLAALLQRFQSELHPRRERPRKAALEWLAGSKVLDTLLLYPEVNARDFNIIVGALALIEQQASAWEQEAQPELGALYGALENRMLQSGGPEAVVPQNSASEEPVKAGGEVFTASTHAISSGRELMEQAKRLAKYLRDQPEGWLSGHRLMKSVRWDTLHQLPALDATGKTRLLAPKVEYRAQLKRLYLQQSWQELLEQADRMFAEGVNHLWFDLQWYLHQALSKLGGQHEKWAEIIRQDLQGLLNRLPGVEGLAWNDGGAFADEVTLNWINQEVVGGTSGWGSEVESVAAAVQDDILLLEPEILAMADKDGIESALGWLQARATNGNARDRWLLRLLMARVAEQHGKNELAVHLLTELDLSATAITLTQWEPELAFEVKARALRLMRMRAGRSESDRQRLQHHMETLLSGLIHLDPVRAAVLCG
ncbi:type VI secretion system protein TssA [Yokenella regensburgei]|uniref:type VI secretion system protein TssA n=1 Tax=Yokenella regensburgei TaxID=158877 RepID=UPI001432DD66|nr:type VI secretion system protein TssA [Yokenella regensburgei]QIU89830.1 type VI secretion system protein TssA [Yokenella regensburgei]